MATEMCERCKFYRALPPDVKELMTETLGAVLKDIPGISALGKLGTGDGQCRYDTPEKGCNEWPMVTRDQWCRRYESA